MNASNFLLVPLMHMAAEDNVGFPLDELIKQEERLLTGKRRGKLQTRRTEDVCMTEHKRVAGINS